MDFKQKLETCIEKNNSLLCIGLDPDIEKLPTHLTDIFVFNKAIIDVTHDLVCSYKPQIAFYASLGLPGLKALIQTIAYIHLKYPAVPVILDAKRGDIGTTAEQYVKEVFDVYKADAVTVNPYLGYDSLEPFLKRRDKGIIVLCRTSNKSAGDFQDLAFQVFDPETQTKREEALYKIVAEKVSREWNTNNNCLLVVGATYPEQLKEIRTIAPNMFFLIPGIGAQGGDLENTLKNGLTKEKSGLIISSSRSIIFASNGKDFAEAARAEAKKLKEEINTYR